MVGPIGHTAFDADISASHEDIIRFKRAESPENYGVATHKHTTIHAWKWDIYNDTMAYTWTGASNKKV